MDKSINIFDFSKLDIWKIEADQDIFLKDYYVEIPAYNELINTNKFTVVWRKWTWKSALKQMFYNKSNNFDCLVDDFQFSLIFNASFFDELVNNYEDQSRSYIDLIKYVLLVRLMLLFVKDESLDLSFREDLNKFLYINWYKTENISSLYNIVKAKSLIKIDSEIWFWFQLWIFNAKGKISKWEISKDKKNSIVEIDYKQILDHLTQIVFSKLNFNNNYILLIDKIDDLWTTYFEIYDNVVLNFIKAVNEINRELRKIIWYDNKSRIIIFLREDLLNRLRWKDANFNKIMQDDLIKLDWQTSYWDCNWLLNELINKRIEKALCLLWETPSDYSKPFIDNVLENSVIINKLKETQFRWKDENITFFKRVFYNRTYLRPRDFVKYFHFLSTSVDHNHFQNQYSEYLWEEIDNELYPILFDVERTKKTLKKICQWKTWKFNSNDFIQIYLKLNYRWIKNDKDINLTAKETLEKLYEYSVIWNFSDELISKKNWQTWEKFTVRKTDVRFKYRESNKTDFDFDKLCIVHAWLYQALWIQFED